MRKKHVKVKIYKGVKVKICKRDNVEDLAQQHFSKKCYKILVPPFLKVEFILFFYLL